MVSWVIRWEGLHPEIQGGWSGFIEFSHTFYEGLFLLSRDGIESCCLPETGPWCHVLLSTRKTRRHNMSANNLWFTGPFWFFRFGVGFPRESGAKLSGLMPVLDHEMVQQNSPGLFCFAISWLAARLADWSHAKHGRTARYCYLIRAERSASNSMVPILVTVSFKP